ncbi:MAG: hypothetical protein WKG00_32735 [Polyangiaceae bacterium]
MVLPDANEEYTVEWGQCENERAPRPVDDASATGAKSTATPRREGPVDYECGNSVVYKTDKLVTVRGNPASHALTYPPPPKPECWLSDAPTAAPTPARLVAGRGRRRAQIDADAGACRRGRHGRGSGFLDAAPPSVWAGRCRRRAQEDAGAGPHRRTEQRSLARVGRTRAPLVRIECDLARAGQRAPGYGR